MFFHKNEFIPEEIKFYKIIPPPVLHMFPYTDWVTHSILLDHKNKVKQNNENKCDNVE